MPLILQTSASSVMDAQRRTLFKCRRAVPFFFSREGGFTLYPQLAAPSPHSFPLEQLPQHLHPWSALLLPSVVEVNPQERRPQEPPLLPVSNARPPALRLPRPLDHIPERVCSRPSPP